MKPPDRQPHSRLNGHDAWPAELAGESTSVRTLRERICDLADRPRPALVVAPRGCDATQIARAVHERARRDAPFIIVDCAETSEVEHVLFGAPARRNGRSGPLELVAPSSSIGRARGGTLVLLSIQELPADAQARLSCILRDGEVRLGSSGRRVLIDLHVVACAEVPLEREVQHGRFRADLLRRFRSAQLELPPLRARREDVGPLAVALMAEAASRAGRRPREFTDAALALLAALDWEGNTADLARVVRALASSADDPIRVEDVLASLNPATVASVAVPTISLREARRQFEREYIAAVLNRSGWRMEQAARILGIQRTNLYRKARQLGIARARAGE